MIKELDWVVGQLSLESRAEVVREAIVRLIDSVRRQEIDNELIEAYTRLPQTTQEVEAAQSNARALVNSEKWEKWW